MITLQSRFTSVAISWTDGSLEYLSARTTDGYSTYIQIWDYGNNIYLRPDGNADWAMLQAIYAADGEFRDGNGDAISVSVYGWRFGQTPESLEEGGSWNPLDAGSYERWQRRYQIATLDAKHQEIQHADESNRPYIVSSLGDVPKQFTVNSAVPVPLTAWRVAPQTATSFTLYLDIHQSENVSATELPNYQPLKALSRWLESVRTVGAEIPASAPQASTSYTGRAFGYTQGGSAGSITFTFAHISNTFFSRDSTNIYTQISFTFNVTAGTYNITQLTNLLTTQTVNLGGSTTMEVPERGAFNIPQRAQYIDFGDGNKADFVNGVPVATVKAPNEDTPHPVMMGGWRVIDYNDLPVNETNNKVFPSVFQAPCVGAIHFEASQTSNRTVRIPDPRELSTFPDNEWRITVHNHNATYNISILDWNATNVITLRPGEVAEFKFSYFSDGTGQLFGRVPIRHQFVVAGTAGVLDSPYWEFNSNNWIRAIKAPTTFDRNDGDVFEHATNIRLGNGQAWTADNVHHQRDFIKVLKAGELRLEQTVEFEILGQGQVPSGHAIELWRRRSGAMTLLDSLNQSVFTGQGNTRTYTVGYSGLSEAGDLYCPMFYYPKTTTISVGQIRVLNFSRTATFEQVVLLRTS